MTGGTNTIRQAIRSELQYFAKELVSDLQRLNLLSNLDATMMDVVADQTISTVAYSTIQLLDLADASSQARKDFEGKLTRQLQIIYIGAAAWKTS